MQRDSSFSGGVRRLIICCAISGVFLQACAHLNKSDSIGAQGAVGGTTVSLQERFQLKPAELKSPVSLILKAQAKQVEKVQYSHRSRTTSFEDAQVRHKKEESIDFVSQAETLKVESSGEKFTQAISILKKDGTASLHDFAMPELGETLEVVANRRGQILRAGDYPNNSIFYVSPLSLPKGPVVVGDTWEMKAQWLSLEEMVPYQLDMASIFKNAWLCGSAKHLCAEIEISGEVTLQGPLAQMMAFKSLWKGFLLFDVDAGTVLWSRVDSEEQFMSGNVRRSVTSCLEAHLFEPQGIKLMVNPQAACNGLLGPGDIAPIPGSMR